MSYISKDIYLNSLACSALGWQLRNKKNFKQSDREKLSLGEKFRIEQGLEVGRKARTLYPDGFIIDDSRMQEAAAKTAEAILVDKITTIFEGAFLVGHFAARADILQRIGSAWHLIEVKSSVNDKDEFVDDMAYTAMILLKSGLDIRKVSLILISKDFRLGMSNRDLFTYIDHTDDVIHRASDFRALCDKVEQITSSASKPEEELSFECRKCDVFSQCLGKDVINHIFEIPRISQSKFLSLMESRIVRIEDIPKTFKLTDNQIIVRDAVQSGKPFVGQTLSDQLARIIWPAFYLDFETVMTAIPLYPEIAPFTQIPTQYSVHVCSNIGSVLSHAEYLADPLKDCRLELAESLIRDLPGTGSIIVYSNFEKTVLNSLVKIYPDLQQKLEALIDRLIDLEAIIRSDFYHPGFHGSTSIKCTLPALVPDMSYEDLPIAEGDSAMAAFAYLAQGKYDHEQTEEVRRNLLMYCKQDTFAMIRLHQQIAKFL